jgi:hypothetical protein
MDELTHSHLHRVFRAHSCANLLHLKLELWPRCRNQRKQTDVLQPFTPSPESAVQPISEASKYLSALHLCIISSISNMCFGYRSEQPRVTPQDHVVAPLVCKLFNQHRAAQWPMLMLQRPALPTQPPPRQRHILSEDVNQSAGTRQWSEHACLSCAAQKAPVFQPNPSRQFWQGSVSNLIQPLKGMDDKTLARDSAAWGSFQHRLTF